MLAQTLRANPFSMRATFLSLLLLLSGAAMAQEAPTAPSPSHIAAARNAVSALLVDSDVLPRVIRRAWAPELANMRRDFSAMGNVSPARLDAAIAFLDTVDETVIVLVRERVPGLADTAAPEIAAIFSESELEALAAFQRDPRAVHVMLAGGATLTAEEQRFLDDFMASPAGRAFDERGEAYLDVLQRHLFAMLREMTPDMMLHIFRGVCEALENECPVELRAYMPQPL